MRKYPKLPIASPLETNSEWMNRKMKRKKKKGWTPWGYPKTGYVVTTDFSQNKTYYNPDGTEEKKCTLYQ